MAAADRARVLELLERAAEGLVPDAEELGHVALLQAGRQPVARARRRERLGQDDEEHRDPLLHGRRAAGLGQPLDPLHRVELQGQESITEPMPGALYSLTFAPPGSATRYRRLHVVLQGESHVFHIIETVPAADELDIETLTGIVAGFREEV